MAYLEKLLPKFRKGAKIRKKEWDKEVFIRFHEGEIYWYDDGARKDGEIASTKDLVYLFTIHDNDWELYQEPIDWDLIIKNRCLCWFWDNNFNCAICGTLGKIEKGAECEFIMFDDAGNRSPYEHCRPVRRYEVNFYNEKE